VNHLGQITAVTISFNLKPGAPLGDAVAAIEKEASPCLLHYHRISGDCAGLPGFFQRADPSPGPCDRVIYIVLGILYESYIHPITILRAAVRRFRGAHHPADLGKDLNLYALCRHHNACRHCEKNAIMMIDFALDAQRARP